MDKKKKNNNKQQTFLSPEKYIRQKARTLPIKACYVNKDFKDHGLGHFVVVREHTGGNVTIGNYLVDTFCLGVKDTSYRFRMNSLEYDEYLDLLNYNGFEEINYDEVHNRIYGSIAFAEEAGIKPHKDFALTRYILEEDTDEIPLIEYEFGKDGKHFLVAKSELEASTYIPTLKKNLGENFDYLIDKDYEDDFMDEEDDWDEDEDEENSFDDLFDIENHPMFKRYGPDTEYTYKHPEYPTSITIENPVVEQILCNPDNACYLKKEQTDTLLALPHESLRHDLEQLILCRVGLTCDGIPQEIEKKPFVGVIGLAVMLLAEVGDSESSLDTVLEVLRQSEDFYDYHIADSGMQFFPSTIYKLGQNRLDKLMDFMKEEGLYSFAKSYIPEAVAMIAMKQPERRNEVLEWFRELLIFATDTIAEPKYVDSTLAGEIVSCVIDIKAKELLPEIKALHDTGRVDIGNNGPYEEVESYILGFKPSYAQNHLTDIYERFDEIRKTWR